MSKWLGNAMTPLTFICAKSNDEDFIKVIVGVIVAIFWVIGGIASAVKKKSDEAQKRARMRHGGVTSLPPATPATQQTKSRQQKRARQQFVAPPPPPPVSQLAPAASVGRTTQPTAPAAKANSSGQVPPDQIARLLKRPETLRAAMILNEILSPPLALRD